MDKKSKIALLIAVLFVILVGVISLGIRERYYLAPGCSKLPDYELVWVNSGKTLAFANINTVTPVQCSLEMSNGWLRDGFYGKPQIVHGNPGLITANNKSQALVLRYMIRGNPTSGYPLVIQEDVTMLKCPENELIPYGSERSWLLSETQIVTVDHDIATGRYRVIIFDMQTCRETDELYVSELSEGIIEATISSQGWLAVQHGSSNKHRITILDADNQEVQSILQGAYPTWSPDGEWLAYVSGQGLYVISKDTYDPIEVGWVEGLSYASWSPDGTKLLYGGYVDSQTVTIVVDVTTLVKLTLPIHIPVRAAAWR